MNDNKPFGGFCLTEAEVWRNNDIMMVNAAAGISMKLIMEFVRAIEAAHGITAQQNKRIQ